MPRFLARPSGPNAEQDQEYATRRQLDLMAGGVGSNLFVQEDDPETDHSEVLSPGDVWFLPGEELAVGLRGEKGDQGEIGPGLEFTWNGSELGVRVEGTTTYNYVDLKGDKGDKGDTGELFIGTVETLPEGSSASVANSGTTTDAVLDFGIPKGDKGDKGDTGFHLEYLWQGTELGVKREDEPDFTYVNLQGPKGDVGDVETHEHDAAYAPLDHEHGSFADADHDHNSEYPSLYLVENPAITQDTSGWEGSGSNGASESPDETVLSYETQDFYGENTGVLNLTSDASVSARTVPFSVDPSKAYRVTMHFKTGAVSPGRVYLGVVALTDPSSQTSEDITSVSDVNGTTAVSSNVYVQNDVLPTDTEWTRLTFYIMPAGTSPGDMTDIGNRVSSNVVMHPSHRAMRIRFLNWSNTAGTPSTLYAAMPSVTEVDPQQVTRNSVLKGGEEGVRSGKDDLGVFTVIEWFRKDGTRYKRSVVSGGESPQYTSRAILYYASDGVSVLSTVNFDLIYDADGDLIEQRVI